MNIFIAGGMGGEQYVISILRETWPGAHITFYGGEWDISSQTFPPQDADEYIPQYFDDKTEADWESFDLYVDLSAYRKSKYLLSERAARLGIRCIVLNPSSEYLWWDSKGQPHSLASFIPYSYPEISNLKQPVKIELLISSLKLLLNHPVYPCFANKEPKITVMEPAADNDPRWEEGLMRDVVAEACGGLTVSLTPTEDRKVDLAAHAAELPEDCKVLRQSPFFLEFTVGALKCMLFKQGRLMVSDTLEPNDGKYLYRRYVGS